MKFATAALVAVLAALAEAKVALTNSNYDITEGEPFTLKWSGNTGPVTITLKTGSAQALKDVTVLEAGTSDSSFTWTPENIPSGTYAFEIKEDGTTDVNYSPQFQYEGTGTLTTSASTKATTATKTSTTSEESSTSESKTTSSETSETTTGTTTKTSHSSTETSSDKSSSSSSTRSSSPTTLAPTSTPTTTPNNTNNSQNLKSPLALLLLTVGALFFFH